MATAGVYPFEGIDDALPYVPLAGRRALDALGRKLSLEGWLSLALEERCRIVVAGAAAEVDLGVLAVVDRAIPAASPVPPRRGPEGERPPPGLAVALGSERPIDDAVWRRLSPLDRFSLAKYAAKPEKLAPAYDCIVGLPAARFTHLTAAGDARMVGVGEKGETARRAVASACVRTTAAVAQAIASGALAKGDVLSVARVAGILAAKRTPELIPLCHPVRTTRVVVDFAIDAVRGELRVRATAEAVDRTGVEMEAMVAASVASLTVYDMIKSADRWATIDAVRLEEKSGGKSGPVTRPGDRGGA